MFVTKVTSTTPSFERSLFVFAPDRQTLTDILDGMYENVPADQRPPLDYAEMKNGDYALLAFTEEEDDEGRIIYDEYIVDVFNTSEEAEAALDMWNALNINTSKYHARIDDIWCNEKG